MKVINMKTVVTCAMLVVFSVTGCQRTQADGPTSDRDQTYEILLDRQSRSKVGTRYELSCEGNTETITKIASADGTLLKPVERQSAEITIKAIVTRLAQDTSGAINKASIAIQNCQYRLDGGPWQELKAGTVLLTEPGDGPKWRLYSEANSLPDDFVKRFSEFLASQNRSNDLSFSPKERKKVGDRWPLDVEHFTKAEPPPFLKGVRNKDWQEGWVTLAGIEEASGQPCMRINWTISNKPNAKGILSPPGFDVTEFEARTTSSWLYPLDVKLNRISDSDDVQTVIELKANSGQHIGLTMHMSRTLKCNRTYRELPE